MVKFTARLPRIRTDRLEGWVYAGRADHDARTAAGDTCGLKYAGNRNPPYLNPLIAKMRNKLKEQKVNFTEVSDGEFVTFTTI